MGFEPSKHMMQLQGKNYLPVAPRVQWLREEHPDWGIITEELFADEAQGVYRFKAQIIDPEGRVIATGHGRETAKGFAMGPYEKGETIAIGRALSAAGYGTLESLDYQEDGESKLADSPQEPKTLQSEVHAKKEQATGGTYGVCNDCCTPITGHTTKAGKSYTAKAMHDFAVKDYGVPLCKSCGYKRKQEAGGE